MGYNYTVFTTQIDNEENTSRIDMASNFPAITTNLNTMKHDDGSIMINYFIL